jgi:hypothetical protein
VSLDNKLDALLSNVTPALRDTLRAAYDLGYREALAAAASLRGADRKGGADENGDAVEVEPASTEDSPANAHAEGTSDSDAPDASDSGSSTEETSGGVAAVDWSGSASASTGEDREHATADGAAKKAPLLRILPHATVGTLLDRIRYHFDLARFDVDVIICRKGDRDRRSLKSSVRLSKYEVET